MRSGTSFFDWTVLKKTVLRFWPLWAAYFVIWLVCLPLNGMMLLRLDAYNLNGSDSYIKSFADTSLADAVQLSLPMAVVFGALAAMAVFSHLYNARSANLFGSLPVRREGLFVSHYLAGLSYLIVPSVAVFLLTLAVEAVGGYVNMQTLLFWLGVNCGECFLFYSMAVFCGMFTGHILALPAFYAILNVFAFGVVGLFYVMLQSFFYGFSGFGGWVDTLVEWLTPVQSLGNGVGHIWRWVEDASLPSGDEMVLTVYGLGRVCAYALAAAVLTVCAFFLYRARRLESAGDVVSVKPMRPVFKYGMAICVGTVFGVGTTWVLGGGEFILMAAILIWGVAGCFAAQMLLDKSFRVFQKWKGAAAVAGAFIVLFLVVGLDLTGFETRVPNAADVRSVYVYGLNAVSFVDDGDRVVLTVDDPEQIGLLVALHRAAVDERDRQVPSAIPGARVELNYTLNNGSTLRRTYYVDLDPGDIGREGSAAWAVETLQHDMEFYWRVYGFDILEERIATGGRLDSAELSHYDDSWGYMSQVVGYGSDARALLDAVEEDLRAGRIGVRSLTDPRAVMGGLPLDSLIFRVNNPVTGDTLYSVDIALQDTASSTLAVLERLAADVDLTGEDGRMLRNALEGWIGKELH